MRRFQASQRSWAFAKRGCDFQASSLGIESWIHKKLHRLTITSARVPSFEGLFMSLGFTSNEALTCCPDRGLAPTPLWHALCQAQDTRKHPADCMKFHRLTNGLYLQAWTSHTPGTSPKSLAFRHLRILFSVHSTWVKQPSPSLLKAIPGAHFLACLRNQDHG